MYFVTSLGPGAHGFIIRPCVRVHNNNTLQHETWNHSKQYTFADLNKMLFYIISIILTILSLAYHFMGAKRDRWGLKRPPCSKWGMTEKVWEPLPYRKSILSTTYHTSPTQLCYHASQWCLCILPSESLICQCFLCRLSAVRTIFTAVRKGPPVTWRMTPARAPRVPCPCWLSCQPWPCHLKKIM